MSTRIKICGVTTLSDARYAAGAGADLIGFVQYRSSPRFIDADRAREIIDWLYGPEPVGVFVDETALAINSTVEQAGFKYVQLHGSESADYCASIDAPVIKSFALRPGESGQSLADQMTEYESVIAYALLDTYAPGLHGGSGQENRFADLVGVHFPVPFFIAGGLRPSNVGAIVRSLAPIGVDVSSGVEASPGVKDFDKIDAFIAEVRRNGNELTESSNDI